VLDGARATAARPLLDAERDSERVVVPGAALTVGFRRLARPAELAALYTLRQRVFRGRFDYLLANRRGMHPAEDRFDATAFHFGCDVDGELVAACRFAPAVPAADDGSGRAACFEASELCAVPDELVRAPDRLLQVSRVVVRDDLRRCELSEVLLLYTCAWLARNTSYLGYFALCLPRLARFYEHFGAEAVGEPVRIAAREGNEYRFVRGTLERSIASIHRHLSVRIEDGVERPRREWRLPDVYGIGEVRAGGGRP